MELSKQVVSLELAQKLKELGVKQESFFIWKTVVLNGFELTRLETIGVTEKDYPKFWSAFTVAELGNLLKEVGPALTIKAYGDVFGFPGTGAIGSLGMLYLLTEPDRLAKMLIYLLENNFI